MQIRWMYAVPIVVLHLAALAALWPTLFSWTGLALMLAGLIWFGTLGINLCYHRLLSHRSFQVPKWLERTLVINALCNLQDNPCHWVAVHRHHHVHSDEEPDAHTPRSGIFWSHMGWLMAENPAMSNLTFYEKYARDLLRDPFYQRLLSSPLGIWIYVAHALAFAAAGAAIGYLAAGTAAEAGRMAASLLVWGVVLRTVAVWHITWSVNSLTHVFGYRTFETGENSRNNWFVAVVAMGEGWHNNHHWDPAAATVRVRWWEFDPTWWFIRLLERLGLATNVIPPRHARTK